MNHASEVHTRLLLGTFVLSAALYLASTGRTRPWGDGFWQARQAAHLSVGRLDMDPPPPGKGRFRVRGKDGRWYLPFSLGAALSHAPGNALATLVLQPQHNDLGWAITHRVSSTLWGAATVTLLLLFLLQLGAPPGQAFAASLAMGLCTQLWVYAHSDFSECFQAFCVLFGVWTLWRAADSPTRGRALLVGLAAGLLVVAKMVYLPILAFGGLWLCWRLRDRRPDLARACAWALLPFAPLAAAELAWNWIRSGHLLQTARRFDHFTGPLDGDLLVGLFGLLASPGKSVFLFSPLLVLVLFGVRDFWRRDRGLAVLVSGVVGLFVLIHAKYIFWHGAWSFGPRFLTAVVPVACLAIPVAAFTFARRLRAAALVLVLVLGAGVQVVGNSYYASAAITVSHGARRALLARSPRRTRAWAHENQYLTHFVPHFAPIRVHWWLLETELGGRDQVAARRAAPWAPFFPDHLNLTVPVPDPEVDYWFVGWLTEPRFRAVGQVTMLAILSLLLLAFALLSPLRRRSPATAAPRASPGPPPPR